ncbi:MAG: Gfo/Idh/MocA family oxidoreductase, partial [Verrucomicrobiota bacterium]
SNPKIDAVYIATPHPFHQENSILCLKEGKAVLCEKPFTINALEAAEVIDVAKEQKQFLMEGMWSRFLPHVVKARELIQSGAIGDPRLLQADFGFKGEWNPEGRLFNPHLGGGALLDVGVYPISLSFYLFGAPKKIQSQACLGKTGVDEQASLLFEYEGGRMALLSTSIQTTTPQEAVIMGSEGSIRLHRPWWGPSHLTLTTKRGDEVMAFPKVGNGYNYEAEEVGRCLREGLFESPVMPWDESLAIMKTMDALRKEWGLVYPMEK